MRSTVLTRWEHLRELTGGSQQHVRSVRAYLASHPAVLYYGDSWFSTPLYRNLAQQSAEAIDGIRMIVGKPGAQAKELFDNKSASDLTARVKAFPFDVVALSAGGNDVLSARLKVFFKPWMEGKKAKLSADAAFASLLEQGAFERIAERYRHMLKSLQSLNSSKRQLRVVGHGYLPLHVIGKPGDLSIKNIGLIAILKDDVGPWLYGPMKRVLEDPASAKEFATLLLVDGFKKRVLDVLSREFHGFFSAADLRGAKLNNDQYWYDEIHPTEAGFARCVPSFNAEIRAAIPKSKQQTG
jgi:hypothetical protein